MIKKGDVVDIISISTPCSSEQIEKIKNYLKEVGLKPRIFLEKETSIAKNQTNEFATISAKTRFEQLKKAIESDSKIIWCSRGGYGNAEILPFLMKMKKPKNPKFFIGFSDLSSVNIFLIQKWNWQLISAPMLLQLALNKVSKESEKAILDLVFGKTKELKYKLELLNKSPKNQVAKSLTKESRNLRGPVVGGCLSVISGHFGTKNQIDFKGKILFLEDEGEDGERLDRYFYQIVTIINETKSKPTAIVLGNFLQANPHGTPQAKNIEIAIARFAKNLADIPLFSEKSKRLGHSKDMMPFLLGVESEITKNGILTQKI